MSGYEHVDPGIPLEPDGQAKSADGFHKPCVPANRSAISPSEMKRRWRAALTDAMNRLLAPGWQRQKSAARAPMPATRGGALSLPLTMAGIERPDTK
ncbi:hypothetical protein LMG28688_06061 [Paraburkholderia caffeinitolerans]|uniref:Uncharacterized protein n=1 Tax=Paraburkholderia caffeinitolerans TaxID=1723730 RepID=A0A6J5GPR9_9BURK|nr:hypothetical protein [Paraburkholderia caffeinitolerans]CAB3804742.1 hypothetical protein LMG28688_06061 [Paraburkholderia caffeinitolerans]